MRRSPLTTLAILAVALLLLVWCAAPLSLWEALSEPWRVLRDSQKTLHAQLLDVSEDVDAEPFRAASRQLLKPFGALRLNRLLTNDDKKN